MDQQGRFLDQLPSLQPYRVGITEIGSTAESAEAASAVDCSWNAYN
jgi:hypothetical protein